MINTPYTYNNFVLNNEPRLYHLSSIEGFDDEGIRETREDKPASHGQSDYGQFLAERLITLNGTILAESSSQRDIARQALLDAFIKDGIYRWLTWQVDGEEAKQIYCKVFSKSIKDDYSDDPFMRDFTINLLATDPRIYSQIETTTTIQIPTSVGGRTYPKTYPKSYGTARIGGSANCINSGNFETMPLVKMYGPLVSPIITNFTDDSKFVKVNMTIESGYYIEINFESKTIMLTHAIPDGRASRYNYLSSDSKWFSLLKGNNSITFNDSGGNISAYAQILYRSAWI